MPSTIPMFSGFQKVKYFSVENTGIRKFSRTYLQYALLLEVLKLSKNDIGDFIKNTNGVFFGSYAQHLLIYI